MENLVLSSGYGYPPAALRTFLKSISRNMKSADVVLFYHDTSEEAVSRLREYLEVVQLVKPSDLGRRAISILSRGRSLTTKLIQRLATISSDKQYSSLLFGHYHGAELARYFWAADYCERLDIGQYKRVMLCDSRDVVVQSDVFDKIDDISFITGAEEKRIGECDWNRGWIYNCYGSDILRMLSDQVTVCSGVSLGPRKIVLEYLRAMTQEVRRINKSLYGHDQGIHNYLIRTNALNFPVRISKSADGIIATLGYYDIDKIVVDAGDNVSVEKGIVPGIIHQYDRFPDLFEHFGRIYT
jgi:hypothetical protein